MFLLMVLLGFGFVWRPFRRIKQSDGPPIDDLCNVLDIKAADNNVFVRQLQGALVPSGGLFLAQSAEHCKLILLDSYQSLMTTISHQNLRHNATSNIREAQLTTGMTKSEPFMV